MKKTTTSTRLTGAALALAAALLVSACAGDPAGSPSGATGGSSSEAPGNETPDNETPGADDSDNGAPGSDTSGTGSEPVIGGPDTAVVQVGARSHTFQIPDHLSDMCSIEPQLGLLTVRDMRDDTEFFEWKFDEPGYNGVVFAVESPAQFYVAGESQAEAYSEALDFFGVTTPVPAVTEAMFDVKDGSAQGSIEMLDLLADSIVTVDIHITCD